jgi:hypothetical protein
VSNPRLNPLLPRSPSLPSHAATTLARPHEADRVHRGLIALRDARGRAAFFATAAVRPCSACSAVCHERVCSTCSAAAASTTSSWPALRAYVGVEHPARADAPPPLQEKKQKCGSLVIKMFQHFQKLLQHVVKC